MTRFGRELCVGLAAVLMAGTPAAFGQDGGVVRIGVARFSHETCTFCPRETGVAEWEFYGAPLRGDDVLTESPYVQGFVAAAREYQNVDVVGAYAPRNALGGSSGSWITREAFDKYSAGIARSLAAIDGLDGVYLSLHGAMAVTGVPRPEGRAGAACPRRSRERPRSWRRSTFTETKTRPSPRSPMRPSW